MKRRSIRAAIAGLALAGMGLTGCDVAAPPAPPDDAAAALQPAAKADAPSPASAPSGRATLAPGDKRLAELFGAMALARAECPSIKGAERSGAVDGAELWVARCGNGREWLVKINPDGTTGTMDCEAMAAMGTRCDAL